MHVLSDVQPLNCPGVGYDSTLYGAIQTLLDCTCTNSVQIVSNIANSVTIASNSVKASSISVIIVSNRAAIVYVMRWMFGSWMFGRAGV